MSPSVTERPEEERKVTTPSAGGIFGLGKRAASNFPGAGMASELLRWLVGVGQVQGKGSSGVSQGVALNPPEKDLSSRIRDEYKVSPKFHHTGRPFLVPSVFLSQGQSWENKRVNTSSALWYLAIFAVFPVASPC